MDSALISHSRYDRSLRVTSSNDTVWCLPKLNVAAPWRQTNFPFEST
ncbi:MAG: hypothetical protein NTX64_14330 [Elusimicrobia bacterium]|nr:hypothetical protein [Elusimicrobiota bacterium]